MDARRSARRLSVAGQRQSNTEILDQPGSAVTELDRAVAELAGLQHGVVARWQLTRLGVTEQMIRTRVARGGLLPWHRGVYAVGHRAVTVESRWMAAVLAHGPKAVLSHRSAGQLWGLVPRSSIAPEVTAPGAKRTRKGIVGHRGSLPPDEIGLVNGISVTSVPRTLFDLAATRPEREVERAWNEMEVRRLTDPLSVPGLLERHPGRPGSKVLARLAGSRERSVGITRNELEEAFLALVDAHGLPRPRMNAHLAVRGRFFEVDALWEARRVAVELDGGAVHRTARAFHRDRERDRVLEAEGWRTPRITWDHVRDTPAEVARDLRLILGA
jgi:very-short-patch-repair endonuclease